MWIPTSTPSRGGAINRHPLDLPSGPGRVLDRIGGSADRIWERWFGPTARAEDQQIGVPTAHREGRPGRGDGGVGTGRRCCGAWVLGARSKEKTRENDCSH